MTEYLTFEDNTTRIIDNKYLFSVSSIETYLVEQRDNSLDRDYGSSSRSFTEGPESNLGLLLI
jgi:hypothetical protein